MKRSAPAAKMVDRDPATGASIDQVTIAARVQADPAALRANYGALMLNYSVLDAARKACAAVDPRAQFRLHSYFGITSRANLLATTSRISLRFFAASSMASREP
jgi:hypothetical protein